MQAIPFLTVITLIVIAVIFQATMKNLQGIDERVAIQDEIKALKKKQEEEKKRLTALQSQKIDKNYKLPELVAGVLNEYDKANIRISLEIIEALEREAFTTEKQVYNFIEIERKNLAIETRKKLNKKF